MFSHLKEVNCDTMQEALGLPAGKKRQFPLPSSVDASVSQVLSFTASETL